MEWTALSDEQLAERWREGDVEAFDEACRRSVRRLYAAAWQMLQSREGAWDATQEALLVAWRNRRSYRGEGSPLSWLRGILIRICWAERRKRSYRREVLDSFQGGDDREATEVPDESLNPERVVLGDHDRKRVAAAFAALPEHYRVPLWLSAHEEMPYRDIARTLGVPEGAVKSRINMARRILRDSLERGERRGALE